MKSIETKYINLGDDVIASLLMYEDGEERLIIRNGYGAAIDLNNDQVDILRDMLDDIVIATKEEI